MPVPKKKARQPARRWKKCAYALCTRGPNETPARFRGTAQQKYCCKLCNWDATQPLDGRKGERQRRKKNADQTMPEKVAQEHGGALLRGGKPGNRGNPRGRPRKALRILARELAGELGDELLERIGDKKKRKALSTAALGKLYVDTMKVAVGVPQQVKVKTDGPAFALAVIGPRLPQPPQPPQLPESVEPA